MRLDAPEHVENTRAKIRLLEEMYRKNEQEPGEMTQARSLSMRSIRRMINGMTEDIVRYESRAKRAAADGDSRGLDPFEDIEKTRAKIGLLEELYGEIEAEPGESTQARRLTLQSLRHKISKLTDDLARDEARVRLQAAPKS